MILPSCHTTSYSLAQGYIPWFFIGRVAGSNDRFHVYNCKPCWIFVIQWEQNFNRFLAVIFYHSRAYTALSKCIASFFTALIIGITGTMCRPKKDLRMRIRKSKFRAWIVVTCRFLADCLDSHSYHCHNHDYNFPGNQGNITYSWLILVARHRQHNRTSNNQIDAKLHKCKRFQQYALAADVHESSIKGKNIFQNWTPLIAVFTIKVTGTQVYTFCSQFKIWRKSKVYIGHSLSIGKNRD